MKLSNLKFSNIPPRKRVISYFKVRFIYQTFWGKIIYLQNGKLSLEMKKVTLEKRITFFPIFGALSENKVPSSFPLIFSFYQVLHLQVGYNLHFLRTFLLKAILFPSFCNCKNLYSLFHCLFLREKSTTIRVAKINLHLQ